MEHVEHKILAWLGEKANLFYFWNIWRKCWGFVSISKYFITTWHQWHGKSVLTRSNHWCEDWRGGSEKKSPPLSAKRSASGMSEVSFLYPGLSAWARVRSSACLYNNHGDSNLGIRLWSVALEHCPDWIGLIRITNLELTDEWAVTKVALLPDVFLSSCEVSIV